MGYLSFSDSREAGWMRREPGENALGSERNGKNTTPAASGSRRGGLKTS